LIRLQNQDLAPLIRVAFLRSEQEDHHDRDEASHDDRDHDALDQQSAAAVSTEPGSFSLEPFASRCLRFRILLLLANFGKDGKLEPVIPKISQEILAARVGTTRSRINRFMNKFRKLGLIESNGELKVHTSLLNVIIHD
jgi:hypothetical protein